MALQEHGHFGRAAAASFVSQSALSVGIAELERQLGVPLVDRSKRSIRLTEAGNEAVARARAILRGTEDLLIAAQAASEPLVGSLRMAAIPTVAPFLLPPILSSLSRSHPRLQLYVHEMLTAPACDALHQGAVDCVLLALPVKCGEVEACEVLVDRLLLATRERGDGPSRAVQVQDIDPDRLLLLEDGHCLTDHALAACDLPGGVQDARLIASTLQTLVGLVDAGFGITLLPQLAVSAGVLHDTQVSSRPLDDAGAERRIALVWRKNDPRRAEFELLGRTIRTIVEGNRQTR